MSVAPRPERRWAVACVALAAAFVLLTTIQQALQPGFTMVDPAAGRWDLAALAAMPVAVVLTALGARWAFERRWLLAVLALPALPAAAAAMLLVTTPLGRKVWLFVLVAPRLGLEPFVLD